jgi:hypothetical protein
VDLPFLSFYIMAMLTSIKLLDENNPRAAALHAMVCALLITVRAQGAFVAICTFVFLTADFVVLRRTRLKRLLLNGAVFGLLLTILVYLMWPLLWPDPLGTIMQAGEHNKFVTAQPPPWYYNFVWIGVTTPLLILGLFVAGFGGWAFSAARELSGSAKSFYRRHRLMLLLMLLLVVPLILPAVLGTRLFGGWRRSSWKAGYSTAGDITTSSIPSSSYFLFLAHKPCFESSAGAPSLDGRPWRHWSCLSG